MSKKFMALAACVLSILLLFSACGTAAGEQAPSAGSSDRAPADTPEEITTVKFVMIGDPPADEANVIRAVNEKLKQDGVGVALEVSYVPDSEYTNKVAMIAAAQEDYDICWTMPTTISGLIDKGGLAPLNDALEAHGKDLLNAISDGQWKEVSRDGKIYGIPCLVPSASGDQNMRIRLDFMKKYGIDRLETVADLDKFVRAYHEDHPEGSPFYAFTGQELYREFGEIFAPIGNGMKSPVCILLSDPTMEVRNYYKTDVFLQSVQQIRKWDADGLYDGEEDDSMLVKFSQGLVGVTWSAINLHEQMDVFVTNTNDPNAEFGMVMLHPDEPRSICKVGADNLSIFSHSKKVDAAVKFINWLRGSQEAYDLMSYGVEGVNYVLDGDAVSYEGIPADKQYLPQSWMWSDRRYLRYPVAVGPDYKALLDHWDDNAKTYPFTGFVLNTEPISNEVAQIKALMEEYVPMMRDSKIDFDSTYEEFLGKLEQAGEQKVIDEVANQMQAFIESNE